MFVICTEQLIISKKPNISHSTPEISNLDVCGQDRVGRCKTIGRPGPRSRAQDQRKGRAVTRLWQTDDREFCLWARADTELVSEGRLGLCHHCYEDHPSRWGFWWLLSLHRRSPSTPSVPLVTKQQGPYSANTSGVRPSSENVVTNYHNLAGHPPSLPPKHNQNKPNRKGR